MTLICCLPCLIRFFFVNLLDNLHPNCTRSCPLTSLTEGRSAWDLTQAAEQKKKACSQVFGRAGQLALQQLSLHASSTPFSSDKRLVAHCAMLCVSWRELHNMLLRCMIPSILTDASFDDDKTGLDGIFFNGDRAIISWFAIMLRESQVQKFIRGDAQVVIGELKALAPVMAVD